jgi:hypothetical protein
MNGRVGRNEVPVWDGALRSLGLRPVRGAAVYRNGSLSFSVRSSWGTFASNGEPRRADPLRDQLGRPGLWKYATDAQCKPLRRVFELPPSLLRRAETDADSFEHLAGWALATADGEADDAWSPPPKEEVDSWLPDGALTLQAGAMARQGTLIREDRRLALGFPILSEVPSDLPAARVQWVRELLIDGQNRWRLVRIGLSPDAEARAEVDLTGAPHAALRELVQTGLEALRLVVASIVESADFLVNGAAGCRAVEVGPTGRSPKRKRRKS